MKTSFRKSKSYGDSKWNVHLETQRLSKPRQRSVLGSALQLPLATAAAGAGSRTGALLSFSRAEVSPRVSRWQVLSWHFPVAGTMWGFPRDPGLNVSKVRQGLRSDARAVALASFHPCCKKLTIISHWSNSFNFLVVPFDLNCRLTETQVGYSKLHTK